MPVEVQPTDELTPDPKTQPLTTAKKGLSGFFTKLNPKQNETATPEVPSVPIGRLVSSPKRTLGRGTRDTLLTGADGLQ